MAGFKDRIDAGRRLGQRLERFRPLDVVVLGLPRGGVPVAAEVARALDAPLDVIIVRKLGVPFQSELAMGAVGEDGAEVLDEGIVRQARVSGAQRADVEQAERRHIADQVRLYRRGRVRSDLTGRTAIVVDDGVATESTARVACQIARRLGAEHVVLAVPVGPSETLSRFPEADEVVAVYSPDPFRAVGCHYDDFSPTGDDEVIALLDAADRRTHGVHTAGDGPDSDVDVSIRADGVALEGHLHLPESARGIVLFAHGSGSSRHSPRNRFVASVLHDAGMGTLLLDLLTKNEERDRSNVFDIELLTRRLTSAADWVLARPDAANCKIGYFGASTGAGAALFAAGGPGPEVAAVVSRGGRPDLAGERLDHVAVPTLLIVGSEDHVVLDLNRRALEHLGAASRLVVVPGAGHLFEEPGTLAQAALLARDFFVEYLLEGDQ